MNDPPWKDRVWLSLVIGPLLWMALFYPLVDLDSLSSVCLWGAGSFCLNLGIVSMGVPYLQRGNRKRDA